MPRKKKLFNPRRDGYLDKGASLRLKDDRDELQTEIVDHTWINLKAKKPASFNYELIDFRICERGDDGVPLRDGRVFGFGDKTEHSSKGYHQHNPDGTVTPIPDDEFPGIKELRRKFFWIIADLVQGVDPDLATICRDVAKKREKVES